MFVQIGLLFIFLLFAVSFLVVVVACNNAPVDERFDRREQAMITTIIDGKKDSRQSGAKIQSEAPSPPFLATFDFPMSSPPQES